MTHKIVYIPERGVCVRQHRDDAIKYNGRYTVPTSDRTKWIGNMDEFRAAGGTVCFSEDQTEIELLLPEPYKFGIGMFSPPRSLT